MASGLDTPWDLAWGPDGALWFTERGGSISRLDLSNGRVTRVGSVDVIEVSESGLMGMAFHPDFDREPWVYLVHSTGARGSIRNQLVRLRYENGRLGDPQVLLADIPGAGNHDGSRLVVGPDRFLYMTTGDAQEADRAQDRASLAGKVLRLTLDGRPAPGNPFGTAIYSFGHRNPQGIVFQPGTGALYITEHGPGDNDEVSRVEAGRNHGWPAVRGFCDTSSEQQFCQENEVVEPVAAFTPTLGISGLDIYNAVVIPGWRGNLLATTLRGETLLRIVLTPDGRRSARVERLYEDQYGRLRDVLVGPAGEVYIATSNRDGRGSP
ncbi:MAG: PQQ-dependent sugar dehydrogenase, partial [Gemmatimonadetes bacterium]|nr:PQQ-dependent sugar dehydrogenase [Gemmatimonadota bacterium]